MSDQATATVFEETFKNVQRAAEANLKFQQEMFRQWANMWPGLPTPQTIWVNKLRDFQHEWTKAVSALAHRHHETIEKQYRAALESLDESLRFAEAKDPEEFRKRSEQLCRKTLDCVREISEAQVKEFQDGMNKWVELVTKVGT
jgi:hypothetical protein